MTTTVTPPPLLVSVCVPTYNRADRLRRAIQGLLECSCAGFEIIISDNASTDHTEQVCAELCREHGNIRYFRHPTNQGPVKNFEFARAKATGKYFLWHGDDDYLAVDFIQRCVDELERDSSLVLASGIGAYHQGDHVVTRYGNIVQLNARSGLIRALHFISTVEEGSIFCGVYRRDQVIFCRIPNCLAGDHVWLCNVLLQGKAKVLSDTYIYREETDNTSSSMARIVATFGLPAWQAKFPWVVIPHNLAHGVAYESAQFRPLSVPGKWLVYLTVYVVSFARQWIYAAFLRWPNGQEVRRYLLRR